MSNIEKLTADAQVALMEGEKVLDATVAVMQVHRMGQDNQSRRGILLVTDRRVVLFTKKIGGYDVTDFTYGLLSAVDHKTGFTGANITFAAGGASGHVKVPKESVERIAQLVRERMAAAADSHTSSSQPSTKETDVAEQIRQLAALKDEGLLTSEEFEAKKKQLLGL